MPTVLAVLLAFSGGTWLDVPFTRQAKDGCGSASIWMLMQYWRPADTPTVEEIHRAVFSPEAGGVYASNMERYFASHGFRTLSLTAQWQDLQDHLTAGRPLIASIESNARLQLHYVVVAGVDDANGIIYVNDPADRKLRAMYRSDFEKKWKATGNWTLLVVPNGEPRAGANSGSDPELLVKQGSDPELASAPGSPDLIEASKAFRNEQYSQAKHLALLVLRENPKDRTTNELLGTIFYLQNNLEASLKYWNRAEGPKIQEVRVDPPIPLDPIRLDHVFEFSPASVFTLDQYRRTVRNLNSTEAFSAYTFELTPANPGSFDLTLRSTDRSGVHYLSALAGLPFRSVRGDIRNIRGETINLDALVRWDSRKERAWMALSTPVGMGASRRLALQADGRREEWDLSGTRFVLRKMESSIALQSRAGSRGNWSSGVVFGINQHRGTVGYVGAMDYDVVRVPEHRIVLSSGSKVRVQRLASERFAKLDTGVQLRWSPRASGDDLETSLQVQGGWASTQTPIDELFALGIDRDNPGHLLRAHPATRSRRKGAAVYANQYGLLNAEIQKIIHEFPLVRVSVVPFVDTARTGGWFVDTGLDLRLRLLSRATFSFSIGRDLMAGKTVGYLR